MSLEKRVETLERRTQDDGGELPAFIFVFPGGRPFTEAEKQVAIADHVSKHGRRPGALWWRGDRFQEPSEWLGDKI